MTARNVLLITTDQQRADTLGAYGSTFDATPNLDALAREGATFDFAHCQHPYCQPSRWTMLTGQHPRTHGVWSNGVDPTSTQIEDALSTRLSTRGVRTSFFGKAHFATNGVLRSADSPFMEAMANAVRMPDDWHGPYMGFDYVELLQLGHYPFGYGPWPLGLHYGKWLARDGRVEAVRRFLRGSPVMSRSHGRIGPQTWHSSLPEELHPTTWVADRAISWLEANAEESFFAWVSFADPHHPMAPPFPWCDRFDPESMPTPRRDVRELDEKPPWQKRFSEGLGPLARALNPPFTRATDAGLRAMIAAYYGMVAQVDHAIGRVLRALASLGRAADTLVVFTTDHGELLGDHGLLFKGPFHYEGLLRVPLVMRGPGVVAGARVADPVGTIDLVPTFERALSLSPSARVEGRDLFAVLDGRERRSFVLTENDHRIGFREHVQSYATPSLKLNRHVGRDYGELYDLDADPGEKRNLWQREPELRARLSRELDDALPESPGPLRKPVGWLPA